jgi:hypothetical protein
MDHIYISQSTHTNLFKSTDLNGAYRACNTIYNQLCDIGGGGGVRKPLVEYINYSSKHVTNCMLARLEINRNKTPGTYKIYQNKLPYLGIRTTHSQQ